MTGGSIHGRLALLVGPLCEQSFEQVHADIAILGGTGVTESGVWNHDPLVIAAQRKTGILTVQLSGAPFSRFSVLNTWAYTSTP